MVKINPVYEFLPYFQMLEYSEKFYFWYGQLIEGEILGYDLDWSYKNMEYFDKKFYGMKLIVFN